MPSISIYSLILLDITVKAKLMGLQSPVNVPKNTTTEFNVIPRKKYPKRLSFNRIWEWVGLRKKKRRETLAFYSAGKCG